MEIIRKNGLDKETIYTCYVIDDKKHLVGVLPCLLYTSTGKAKFTAASAWLPMYRPTKMPSIII